MTAAIGVVWSWIRAVSGDSAYESYAGHARSRGGEPVSREAFYLDTLGRRYSTVNRCC